MYVKTAVEVEHKNLPHKDSTVISTFRIPKYLKQAMDKERLEIAKVISVTESYTIVDYLIRAIHYFTYEARRFRNRNRQTAFERLVKRKRINHLKLKTTNNSILELNYKGENINILHTKDDQLIDVFEIHKDEFIKLIRNK